MSVQIPDPRPGDLWQSKDLRNTTYAEILEVTEDYVLVRRIRTRKVNPLVFKQKYRLITSAEYRESH